MQARNTTFDIRIQDLEKPSLALCLWVLGGTWLGLLLHDLLIIRYASTSPASYGFFRSIAPLVALLPMFVRLLKPDDFSSDQEVLAGFRRLTYALNLLIGGIAFLSILPLHYSPSAVPADLLSFLVGRLMALVALIGMPVVAEELLRLYRYRSRGPVPRLANYYAYGLILIVALSQLLPLPQGEQIDLPTVANAIGGVLGFLAVILSIRAGWIVYLKKKEKTSLLGISFLGIIGGGAAVGIFQDSEQGKALFSLFPGLQAMTLAVGVPALITQLAVFFKTLFSLPTAGAIDRRNMEVSSLANFARLLTQSFDMKELVDTAIVIACDVTGATAAWIEIVRDGGHDVLHGSSPRLPGSVANRLMSAEVEPELTLSQATHRLGRAEVIHRVPNASWEEGEQLRQLQSVAAAPLRLGSTLFGTLYVAKEKANDFDREDITILSVVADQIALALEQSRLIQTSIERERFEQEMLIARDFQRRLLPKVMPESPFYELHAESQPASMVGGDYYDIVTFSDQTIGVVIADVSGKGASAALYMGMVKGIIQALSGKCETPKELLTKANMALYGNIDQRCFVTMTCAQIIEPQRRLRIARAGHCPTLMVREGEGCYSTPTGLGLAIARPLLFDRNLELEERCFAPGDATIFFSDGLPEARSPGGEELGYDRLLAIVEGEAAKNSGASKLRDAIFEGISTFTEGEPPEDDSTLVIIRWR